MGKFFIENDHKVFDIEVVNTSSDYIDFECILDAIKNRIGEEITPETHSFEIFNPLTTTYKNIEDFVTIRGSRFVKNLSVIKISAKPQEEFKCSVDFFDNNQKKYSFDVVVDHCMDESAKYHKLMDKFWDMCGQQFPINYTFEVFDEETNEYKILNKRKPHIPNGSMVRIRPSTPSTDNRANTPDVQYNSCETETKSEPKIKKKIVEHKPRPNPTLSDWISKELSSLGIEEKYEEKCDEKCNEDLDLKEEKAITEYIPSFESTQERNDYYLTISLIDCLKDNKRRAFEQPLAFFQLVSNIMKNDYKFLDNTAEECRLLFEDLFHRYFEILKTTKNVIEAQTRLKCFKSFDSIDLSLFLTPNVYQRVDYLRYKLWYGIEPELNPIFQYRTCGQPFINTAVHPLAYPFTGCPLYYKNHCHCNRSDPKIANKSKDENAMNCHNSD